MQTGFIQTESPYWLDEAYSSAITALDLGLVSRNFEKAEMSSRVIDCAFPNAARFVDYGGGYGMFTRIMRDRGYEFRHYDTHCQNLFARNFEISSPALTPQFRFDLLTAWEVFEHLASPRESISEMLAAADAILFSTELVPGKPIRDANDWWYFAPETGQHVSFYTLETFEFLAEELSLFFYSDGACNHILSKVSLDENPFFTKPPALICNKILRRLLPSGIVDSSPLKFLLTPSTLRYLKSLHKRPVIRESLLQSDFQSALKLLRSTYGLDEDISACGKN